MDVGFPVTPRSLSPKTLEHLLARSLGPWRRYLQSYFFRCQRSLLLELLRHFRGRLRRVAKGVLGEQVLHYVSVALFYRAVQRGGPIVALFVRHIDTS